MNYFEQKLSSDIVRRIGSRLADFDFKALSKSEASRQTEGIKDCVASGTNEIRILAENRFEIDLGAANFSRAVTKDYFDGLARIQSLSNTFSFVLGNDSCDAWQIVTLYYIGFFSAVEILRASGEYVSFFNSNVIGVVEQSATVNAGKLEAGSYQGIARYSESTGNITISYVKSNVRHHQYAWSSVASLVKASCKGSNKEEAEIIGRVVEALGLPARRGAQIVSPSDTRNHWNYEDPKLFGKSGKAASAHLMKLMRSPGASLKWVRSKSNLSDLSSATCALGFSSDFLKTVIEGLGERIVPN